jgi:hypothetical protein
LSKPERVPAIVPQNTAPRFREDKRMNGFLAKKLLSGTFFQILSSKRNK